MTGPSPPALALRAVRKTYRVGFLRTPREVLHGLDLELEPGGRLGLVGPNGSGKTTLLRIASGIERASAGDVRLFGEPVDRSRARKRLGFLPELSPFPPEISARQALDLLGSLQGMGAAERRRRGAELLVRVGLAEHAKKALGKFSKGMLRRFGLAQAFLHEPDLVLLDEPTAGLDAEGFVVLDELLEEAHRRGAAVVLCSHLLGDVRDHCDRIAVLMHGSWAAQGEWQEVVADTTRVRIEVADLDDAALARLEDFVREAGGRLLSKGPVPARLIEIYRRLGAGREGEA